MCCIKDEDFVHAENGYRLKHNKNTAFVFLCLNVAFSLHLAFFFVLTPIFLTLSPVLDFFIALPLIFIYFILVLYFTFDFRFCRGFFYFTIFSSLPSFFLFVGITFDLFLFFQFTSTSLAWSPPLVARPHTRTTSTSIHTSNNLSKRAGYPRDMS